MALRKKYSVGWWNDAVYDVPVPKNLSYSWSFGSVLGIFFTQQILSGVFLSFHYGPSSLTAFENVVYIERDIYTGWVLRLMHANGASFLMFFCYMHLARGMYFGSYTRVKLVWYSGLVLLVLMMAAAFLGYVLPWGQMSFWGATVITNLFSVIPFVGDFLVSVLWGGYTVGDPTLNRFFVLHFLIPLVMAPLVLVHMALLHNSGSSNPLGAPSGSNVLPFHPHLTSLDGVSTLFWLFIFGMVVLLFPHALGSPDNFEKANPMKTPPHIQPEWYFLPFYAVLRSIPHKTGGVVTMVMSILILFFLALLSSSVVSGMQNSLSRELLFICWLMNLVSLGWIGGCPLEIPYLSLGLMHTLMYFVYFPLDTILSQG